MRHLNARPKTGIRHQDTKNTKDYNKRKAALIPLCLCAFVVNLKARRSNSYAFTAFAKDPQDCFNNSFMRVQSASVTPPFSA